MSENIIEICAEKNVHDELVRKVQEAMPLEEEFYDLADFFKNFGDPTRLKILYALMESDMCVCDISETLGISQSAVSHQLRILKQAKLVRFVRDGKSVIYSLDDDHVRSVIEKGKSHIEE